MVYLGGEIAKWAGWLNGICPSSEVPGIYESCTAILDESIAQYLLGSNVPLNETCPLWSKIDKQENEPFEETLFIERPEGLLMSVEDPNYCSEYEDTWWEMGEEIEIDNPSEEEEEED